MSVRENIKVQHELLLHLSAEGFELRSNDDKGAFDSLDLRKDLIQSFQLQIAVRSPHAAKKAHDEGSSRQQGTGGYRPAVLIWQFE